MKKRYLLAVLLLSMLCSIGVCAQFPSYACGGTRGVYYGGQMHYLSTDYWNQGNKMCHWAKTVSTSSWEGPWVNNDKPTATTGLPSGWSLPNSNSINEYGQGIVVNGSQLINYSVAFDSGNHANVLATWYDLAQKKFIDSRGIYKLSGSSWNGWGCAAAMFNGKIYVFLSECTLVSEDGSTYTKTGAIASGISSYQPMDAVTYYPADNIPRVMVLFSTCKSDGAGYVTWDGTATLPQASSTFKSIGSSGQYITGALMVGSAHSGSSGSCSFDSGDKALCVQIFLQYFVLGIGSKNMEHKEFNTTANTVKSKGECFLMNNISADAFRVFPWYKMSLNSTTGFWAQQQEIVVNVKFCDVRQGGCLPWETNFALASDWMVPQDYHNYTNGYGWQGVPTVTTEGDDATEEKIRRSYWSLAGVILGPPPFATNGLEDFEIRDLSNVTYGGGGSSSVKHTHSWENTFMISSDTEVFAGIKDVFGFKANFDIGYKYGMQGANTQAQTYTADYSYTCGTNDESSPDWGKHGWAIFVAPTLLVQYVELYAYDYSFGGTTGTKLGQQVTSVVGAGPAGGGSIPAIDVKACRFSLEYPGSSYDQYPGLMNGMQPFPGSEYLNSWEEMVWEYPGMPWDVIYGTGTMGGNHVSSLSTETTGDFNFSATSTNETSNGTTQDIDMSAGMSVTLGCKLLGMKESINAGYDCKWSNKTTTDTEISQNIKFGYGVGSPPDNCDNQEWVHDIEVQPFLLKPQDNIGGQPWIPSGYAMSKPWCMTWKVKNFHNCLIHIGGGPPPDHVDGNINGTTSEDACLDESQSKKWSSYSISGGHMVWEKSDGTLEPIPMTADQFVPALGATVKLNSSLFTADASSGTWKRNGSVWKFKTKASSKSDIVTIKLDFDARTWSFDGEKLMLAGHLKAGDSHTRVALNVNGKYGFSSVIVQNLKADWELKIPQTDPQKFSLTEYSGCFGWQDREDKIFLEGKLPAVMEGCGDLSFILNGHRHDYYLLADEEFVDAFQKGKEFVHKAGDTKIVVDFKKKTWSAQFKKGDFDGLMAPHGGRAKIEVKMGGATLYSAEHPIAKYSCKLSYKI